MAKFIFILVSRAYVRLVNSLPPKNCIPQKHYFLWLKLKAVNYFCETLDLWKGFEYAPGKVGYYWSMPQDINAF